METLQVEKVKYTEEESLEKLLELRNLIPDQLLKEYQELGSSFPPLAKVCFIQDWIIRKRKIMRINEDFLDLINESVYEMRDLSPSSIQVILNSKYTMKLAYFLDSLINFKLELDEYEGLNKS